MGPLAIHGLMSATTVAPASLASVLGDALAPPGRLLARAGRRAALARRRRAPRRAHPHPERARAGAGAGRQPRHRLARLRPAARRRLPDQRPRVGQLAHAARRRGRAAATRRAGLGHRPQHRLAARARAAARRGRRPRRGRAGPPRAARSGTRPPGCPSCATPSPPRFTERGVPTTADQVLDHRRRPARAAPAAQAAVRGPGDRVLVDAPAYPRTLSALRGARARPVAVPLTPSGWDVEAWERTLSAAAAAARRGDAGLPQPDRA